MRHDIISASSLVSMIQIYSSAGRIVQSQHTVLISGNWHLRWSDRHAERRCYSFYIVCALAQAASPPSVLWAFTIDLLSQTMASSQDYLYASENLFWQWCRSGSWCDLQCPAHRLMPHHAVMSMARCGSWWLALHTHTHSLSLLLEIEIWSNRDPMDSIIIYDGG